MATFDGTKPSYEGSLVSADIRDNFNALKDNGIVVAKRITGRRVLSTGGVGAINEVCAGDTSYTTIIQLYVYINNADQTLYFAAHMRQQEGNYTGYARIYNSAAGGSGALSTGSGSFSWQSEVSLGIGGLSAGWYTVNIQVKTSYSGWNTCINGYTILIER